MDKTADGSNSGRSGSGRSVATRLLPWVVRTGWVGTLLAIGRSIDAATADRSEAIRIVAQYGWYLLWGVGVAALAVAAVITLTAARITIPLAIPVGVVTAFGGGDPGKAALGIGVAALTTVILFSGEIGRIFVQESAYGSEERFPLRPPPAYLLAAASTWAIWAAALIAGPLMLADRRWVVGVVVSAFAALTTVWGWQRWHRLARRWLVMVPVGIVIHDHLVLAETLMLRRAELAAIHLAPADTQAADLTGPAAGHALEIVTAEPVTALCAASPSDPGGKAIHLNACLVSPTRPGQALRAAAARRFPVG